MIPTRNFSVLWLYIIVQNTQRLSTSAQLSLQNSASSPATGTYICSSTDQLSHRAVGLTDNTVVIHRTQYNSSTNTWQHTVAKSNKHAAVHGIQYMKQ